MPLSDQYQHSSTFNFVLRPNLDAQLDSALQKQLLVVSAGGGYGKTQLVSSYIQRNNLRAAWIQLSELDNIPLRMWNKWTESFMAIDPNLGQQLDELRFPESASSFDIMLKYIESSIKDNGPLVLVLDDFHNIGSATIDNFFKMLLTAGVRGLTMVLITRNEAGLALAPDFSGDYAVITEEDLRFNAQEIEECLALEGVRVARTTAEKIKDYTNGWIFAIYLAVRALRFSQLKELDDLTKIIPDMMDMIDHYIYSKLPEQTKKLLIKLSLLENCRYNLLLEIADNDQQAVKQLIYSSALIYYNQLSGVVQIHHLFLDFLRTKQGQLSQEEKNFIHLAAAESYFKQEALTEAIIHYQKASDYKKVAEVLAALPKHCTNKVADFAINVINQIPAEFVAANPQITLEKCKFTLNNFYLEEAGPLINEVIARTEKLPLTDENRDILGDAHIMSGFWGLCQTLFDPCPAFLNSFKRASELLPNGSRIYDSTAHLTAGSYACWVNVADGHFYKNRLEVLNEAIPYLSKAIPGFGVGFTSLIQAEYAFHRYEIEEAEKLALQAIYESKKSNQYDIEDLARFYLMRICLARGDLSNAQSHLAQMIHKKVTNEYYAHKDVYEAWFYLAIDEPEKIARWLKTADIWITDSPITFAFDRIIRAKYFLLTNKYAEFFAYLDKREQFNVEDSIIGAIEIGLLKAIAYYKMREETKAATELKSVYELSVSNQIVIPFIETGKHMRTLVGSLKGLPSAGLPKSWLEYMLTKSSTYAKKMNKVVMDYGLSHPDNQKTISLSKRELQVLNDISFGLTREEIADNNDLSVNTVKNITKSIFNKLGATNAIEAIRIAALNKLLN